MDLNNIERINQSIDSEHILSQCQANFCRRVSLCFFRDRSLRFRFNKIVCIRVYSFGVVKKLLPEKIAGVLFQL